MKQLSVVCLVLMMVASAQALLIEAEDTADLPSGPSNGNGSGTGIVYYEPVANVWDAANNPGGIMYADHRPGEGWSGDFIARLSGGHLYFELPAGFATGPYEVVVRARAGYVDGSGYHAYGAARFYQNGGQISLYRDASTLVVISDSGNNIDFRADQVHLAPGDVIKVDSDWYYGFIDYVELTLIPEPATMLLLGLGGVALLRRKR